jgi:hypothetical protein
MTEFEVDWPARPGKGGENPDGVGDRLLVRLRDRSVNSATIREIRDSRITLIDIWTGDATLSAADIAERAD